MKYLSQIMEYKQTKLFNDYKVFFAFSNDQFKKGMEEKEISKESKVVRMGQGMFCPSENAKEVIEQMDLIYKEAIAEDIKQGIARVILRELQNHECFYTGDITDCVNKLEDYPVTEEEIRKVFRKNRNKFNY